MKLAHSIFLISLLISCSRSESKLKIVKGEVIESNDTKYLSTVALKLDGEFVCTGVAVSPTTVLTASHCMPDPEISNEYAVEISNDLEKNAIESVFIKSASLYKPNMNGRHDSRFSPLFDIAILKLSTAISTEITYPTLLDSYSDLVEGESFTIVGFGRVKTLRKGNGSKRRAEMELSRYYTKGNLKGVLKLHSSRGSSPCYGDSGGPLFLQAEGILYLAGLVIGVSPLAIEQEKLEPGTVCESSYALYTSIYDYLPWLDKNIPEITASQKEVNAKPIAPYPKSFKDWCEYPNISEDQQFLVNYLLEESDDPLCNQGDYSELSSLKSLDIEGLGISDISPLRHLDGLESVRLGNNRIKDISPLGLLASLKEVKIDNNEIDRIPTFASRDIEVLDLSVNQISDLSPLNGYIGLKELLLIKNQIRNVAPLRNLSSLEILVLSKNNIVDVWPLSELEKLSYLGLAENPLLVDECPIQESEKGEICEL